MIDVSELVERTQNNSQLSESGRRTLLDAMVSGKPFTIVSSDTPSNAVESYANSVEPVCVISPDDFDAISVEADFVQRKAILEAAATAQNHGSRGESICAMRIGIAKQ